MLFMLNLFKKKLLIKNKPKIIFSDGKNPLLQQAIESLKNYIDPIILFKKKNDIPKNFPFKTITIDTIDLNKYVQFFHTLSKKKNKFSTS